MEDKSRPYYEKVIWVHSLIIGLTVIIPFTLLMFKVIKINQCFALFGTGFFILCGHTLAFFKSYLEYFEQVEMSKVFEEATVRNLLRFGIMLDFLIAIFFYLLGLRP